MDLCRFLYTGIQILPIPPSLKRSPMRAFHLQSLVPTSGQLGLHPTTNQPMPLSPLHVRKLVIIYLRCRICHSCLLLLTNQFLVFLLSERISCKENIVIMKMFDFEILTHLCVFKFPEFIYAILEVMCVYQHAIQCYIVPIFL